MSSQAGQMKFRVTVQAQIRNLEFLPIPTENKIHCMPTFRCIHPHFTCLATINKWHTGKHVQMVQILL